MFMIMKDATCCPVIGSGSRYREFANEKRMKIFMDGNLVNINRVEQLKNEIIILKNQTAENMIRIGLKLIEAKSLLPHGEWKEWLEEHVEFSQRTASTFMRIAKEFGSNSQSISNLEITKVGLLLEVPQEQREAFMQIYDVKEISTRELKSAIKRYNNKDCSVIDYEGSPKSVYVPVEELKPLPDHEKYFGKRVGEEWMRFLKSIENEGLIESVIIARDYTIIDGHERVRAYKDLGYENIECHFAWLGKDSRNNYSDDELKLFLHLTHNMHTRSSDFYISNYWLDKLFNGKKDVELSEYLTEERIYALANNQVVMGMMKEVIEEQIAGMISEEESKDLIKKLKTEYIKVS